MMFVVSFARAMTAMMNILSLLLLSCTTPEMKLRFLRRLLAKLKLQRLLRKCLIFLEAVLKVSKLLLNSKVMLRRLLLVLRIVVSEKV